MQLMLENERLIGRLDARVGGSMVGWCNVWLSANID